MSVDTSHRCLERGPSRMMRGPGHVLRGTIAVAGDGRGTGACIALDQRTGRAGLSIVHRSQTGPRPRQPSVAFGQFPFDSPPRRLADLEAPPEEALIPLRPRPDAMMCEVARGFSRATGRQRRGGCAVADAPDRFASGNRLGQHQHRAFEDDVGEPRASLFLWQP